MSRPWKHPKTGMYWFRKVVPDGMRGLVGRTEVRRTLRTKDPREAARRFTEVAATVAAEWEVLRQGPKPLTRQQAAALAGLWYRWFIPIFEEDVGEDPDGWLIWSEELDGIDRQFSREVDERDDDPPLPRSPAAQRRVTAFLMDRGRLQRVFLEARDIHLFLCPNAPASWKLWSLSFRLRYLRLLARAAGRRTREGSGSRGPRGSPSGRPLQRHHRPPRKPLK